MSQVKIEIEAEIQAENEVEIDTPVLDAEIEIEIRSPVVEAEIELEVPDIEAEIELDIETPVLEVEIEIDPIPQVIEIIEVDLNQPLNENGGDVQSNKKWKDSFKYAFSDLRCALNSRGLWLILMYCCVFLWLVSIFIATYYWILLFRSYTSNLWGTIVGMHGWKYIFGCIILPLICIGGIVVSYIFWKKANINTGEDMVVNEMDECNDSEMKLDSGSRVNADEYIGGDVEVEL